MKEEELWKAMIFVLIFSMYMYDNIQLYPSPFEFTKIQKATNKNTPRFSQIVFHLAKPNLLAKLLAIFIKSGFDEWIGTH